MNHQMIEALDSLAAGESSASGAAAAIDGAAVLLVTSGVTLDVARAAVDRAMLRAALASTRGRVAESAKVLGLTERTFRRHMRELGVDFREHRPRRARNGAGS